MQVFLRIVVFVIFCFGLLACHEDPESRDEETIYILHGGGSKGYVSAFKPSDDAITANVLELETEPYLSVRSGDNLFIHSYPHLKFHNHLQVIDISTLSIKNSNQYSDYISGSNPQSMSIDNNYLYIPDFTFGADAHPFIKIINKESLVEEDTVNINSSVRIQDVLTLENQLFISLGFQIKVLSTTSFEEIESIDLPPFPSKLILDNDNNILIYNGGILKLHADNFSLTTLKDADTYLIKPAFNSEENVLYIVFPYAQRAPAPNGLSKFNLTTGKTEDLINDSDEDLSFEAKFISYHKASQLIIIGGNDFDSGEGIIKTFTRDGILKKEYTLDTTPVGTF